MKKIISLIVALLLFASTSTIAENATSELQRTYEEAELLMAQGDYFGAATKFDSLGSYSDSSQMAMYCNSIGTAEASGFASSALFDMAIDALQKLGDFRDASYLSYYYTGCKFESLANSIELTYTEISSQNEKGVSLSHKEMVEELADVDLSDLVTNYSDNDLTEASNYYGQAMNAYNEISMFKDSISAWSRCSEKKSIIDAEKEKRTIQILTSGQWVCSFPKKFENELSLTLYDDGTYRFKVGYDDYTELLKNQGVSDVALYYEIDGNGDINFYYKVGPQSGLLYMDDNVTNERYYFSFYLAKFDTGYGLIKHEGGFAFHLDE